MISKQHLPILTGSLLAMLSITACQPAETNEASTANNANEPMLNLPMVPTPDPPIDRAEFLNVVANAASAAASDRDDSADQRSLDGRQFEIRVRFGCRGPSLQLQDESLGWSFDQEKRSLRVRAMPTITQEDALVEQLGTEEFEAVEGFWLPRPWLRNAACPAAAAIRAAPAQESAGGDESDDGSAGDARTTRGTARSSGPAPARSGSRAASQPDEGARAAPAERQPLAQRIGIAQFFTDMEPRSRRRADRPYESVTTLAEGQPISSQGFNLVLTGRLRAIPGRKVVQCVGKGPDMPPDCIVSVVFDRVWIEQPETRARLAEWRPS